MDSPEESRRGKNDSRVNQLEKLAGRKRRINTLAQLIGEADKLKQFSALEQEILSLETACQYLQLVYLAQLETVPTQPNTQSERCSSRNL